MMKNWLEVWRLLRDPRRWVDSDMTRDELLLLAKHQAIFAVVFTVLVIVLAVFWPW